MGCLLRLSPSIRIASDTSSTRAGERVQLRSRWASKPTDNIVGPKHTTQRRSIALTEWTNALT